MVHAMDDDSGDAEDLATLRRNLAHLRQDHMDLDAAVAALDSAPQADQLRIARLKKRKLVLKDQIARLESRLTPDLIA